MSKLVSLSNAARWRRRALDTGYNVGSMAMKPPRVPVAKVRSNVQRVPINEIQRIIIVGNAPVAPTFAPPLPPSSPPILTGTPGPSPPPRRLPFAAAALLAVAAAAVAAAHAAASQHAAGG